MDRLAALFENLAVPEIARLMRRCAVSAIVLGAALFAIGAATGHLLLGFGACIGLGLGLANIRLVVSSVSSVSESGNPNPKRALIARTAYRLGATTVAIIALLFASIQLGFGAAGGIALFYLLLVVNVLRALLHTNASGVVG